MKEEIDQFNNLYIVSKILKKKLQNALI